MFKLYITSLLVIISIFSNAQTKVAPKKAPAKNTSVNKTPAKKSTGKKPLEKGVTFRINGKIEGYKYHLIVLNKFRFSEYLLLDSVTTDAEGNFTIQKTIPEPCIGYLQHSRTSAVPLIIENGAVFNVSITPSENNMEYSITGTNAEKSVNLYNFIKKHTILFTSLGALEQKIKVEEDAMKMQEYQLEYGNVNKGLKMNIESQLLASGLQGYFVLFNFMEEQSPTDVKRVMDKMSPVEKTTIYYKDLKAFYDDNKALEVGALAPDFSLPTPNGDIIKLSDLRGKIVLIDFWASWCGPCRNEFPNVKRVYNRFGDQGFEILGVSLDDQETAWKGSIISLGLNWKHVSDLKKWSCAPAKLYKVTSIPATVLIGKDGRIIAKNLRGEELERKLEELFQ